MARVRYVERRESRTVAALYDDIEATIGRVSNFMRLMAHVPWVLQWSFPLGVSVQREDFGLLDFRLRNLVVVKAAVENRCAY